jgi:hypothetical protein
MLSGTKANGCHDFGDAALEAFDHAVSSRAVGLDTPVRDAVLGPPWDADVHTIARVTDTAPEKHIFGDAGELAQPL